MKWCWPRSGWRRRKEKWPDFRYLLKTKWIMLINHSWETFCFCFWFCSGVQPTNNVVMVSGEQRRESARYVEKLVPQSRPTLCDTIDCSPPGSSVHWGFSRQEYWSGLPFPSPGHLPDSRIKPSSPALQADSLPSEPPGKSKNTGVGCHSLLQGIFPSQGSNPALLHCRQILYHLSYQAIHIINVSILWKACLFVCLFSSGARKVESIHLSSMEVREMFS